MKKGKKSRAKKNRQTVHLKGRTRTRRSEGSALDNDARDKEDERPGSTEPAKLASRKCDVTWEMEGKTSKRNG